VERRGGQAHPRSARVSFEFVSKAAGIPFVVACLAGVLLSSCSPSGPRDNLVILNGAEPESLDPAIVTGQPDLRAVGALFEGLTRCDPKTGAPIPGLAERWTLSPDGRIYTFYLRPNARWSTGEPITSADVEFSWRRALAPATASDYAGQIFCLKNAEEFNRGQLQDDRELGLRSLSAQVLQTELTRPTPYFLDLCTLPVLAVVPRHTIERYGDRWVLSHGLPVSGAYQLEFWHINDKIRLRKNPLYYDAANTQNEQVDILPVGSATTALNLYLSGAADIVWDKELIPSELLDILLKRPDFHPFDYLATYFIRINVTHPFLRDPRVRQALALAVDKQRLVDKITRAGEKVASHLTPPGIPHYQPPEGLSFDPARARKLLAQAGYPDGAGFPTLHYMFNAAAGGSAKTHQKIGVELQQMWQTHLNIQVELRQVEFKVLLAAQSALDYELCRSSWVGDYNDPNTFLDLFLSQSGNNRTGWKDPQYDQELEAGNASPTPAEREKDLQAAERLLVREAVPIIPLFFYRGINYYDPQKIQGIYNNVVDQHPINAIRKLK
jgi:oligopeptide transport system substrate-binding protein